jgi:hypothetical protein
MSDTESQGKPGREQSTVQFPYANLEEAISVARVIHQSGAMPMDRDQIAVRLKQKASSGSFVNKIGAAKMFGIVETMPGTGKIQISALGHEVLDPDEARQRSAKAAAFLSVELYKKLYDEFRGRQLPPRPLGLEQTLVAMGVAPKQRTNARYALDRSAKAAGFFETGNDRLVAPVAAALGPKKDAAPAFERESERETRFEQPGMDKVIVALIEKLPASEEWSADDRVVWLKMMSMAFDLAYGREGNIKITNETGAARAPASPTPSE